MDSQVQNSIHRHLDVISRFIEFDLAHIYQVDKKVLGDQGDYTGQTTCLCIAGRYSSVAIVKLLVRKGADVTLTNGSGNTALHRACRSKIDVIKKVSIKYSYMTCSVLEAPGYSYVYR